MAEAALVLASPDRAFRLALRARLGREPGLRVLEDCGDPERLAEVLARRRPQLLVFDAAWLPERQALVRRLCSDLQGPRLLLCVDRLESPEVMAAVEFGLRGCVEREADGGRWRRAIDAVLADDPWIPRQLLVRALAGLQRRLADGLMASLPEQDLTERQRQIMAWLAEGLSNKEIGRRLGISPATVKTHLHNIFERLGVSGRVRVLSLAAGRRSAA